MGSELLPDSLPCPEANVSTESTLKESPPPSPATPQSMPPQPSSLAEPSKVQQPPEQAKHSQPNPDQPVTAGGLPAEASHVREVKTETGGDADMGGATEQLAQSGGEGEEKSGKNKPPARNRPCVCGSGRKYKNCCGVAKAAAARRKKAELERGGSVGVLGVEKASVEIENLFI